MINEKAPRRFGVLFLVVGLVAAGVGGRWVVVESGLEAVLVAARALSDTVFTKPQELLLLVGTAQALALTLAGVASVGLGVFLYRWKGRPEPAGRPLASEAVLLRGGPQ